MVFPQLSDTVISYVLSMVPSHETDSDVSKFNET